MASIASVIGLDLRSLAVLRMGLGATILIDIADRSRYLAVHYTDAGIFPRFASSSGRASPIGRCTCSAAPPPASLSSSRWPPSSAPS